MTTVGRAASAPVRVPTRSRPLPLLAFFALAYAFSWAWEMPLVATGHTVLAGRGWPTHFPALAGPLLAAVVVTGWTHGVEGVRDLVARVFRWRIGWRWWLVCLSPLGALGVVLAVMALFGQSIPARGEFARFSGLPSGWGVIGMTLTVVVVNGIGEEAGWRGYALPRLQRRFGPVTATLILAVGWAAWHIPQFALLDTYKSFAVPMVPVFFVGLACGAIVLTWLYNRTSSILAVAVWHGLYNVTGGTAAATSGSGAISAAMWTFAVLLAVVLLYLEWHAHRRGRPSVIR